jgi:transposase
MDKTNTPYQIKKIVDIYHVVATHASRVLAMKTTCSSPAFVEQSFYKAFEDNDVDALMAVRAQQDTIEYIHPPDERLQDRKTIRDEPATSVRKRQTAPLAARSALKDCRRTTFRAHFA